MRAIVAAVLFLLVCSSANARQACNGETISTPASVRPVCSATWNISATCAARDLWDQWHITGRTNPADAFIRPFENVPIAVLGYELVNLSELPPPGQTWFMIGSAMLAQPDAMLWMRTGEMHKQVMFPAGYAHIWPARQDARTDPMKDMIDIHGFCEGGGKISLMLTIYYSPYDPASP